MTLPEFNSEFDILYNNIMSNAAPGLSIYEKSVLLTKAQTEIIKAYFSPSGNPDKLGFDMSEIRQSDFSGLIKVDSPAKVPLVINKLDSRSTCYKKPTDALIILNESVTYDDKVYQVTPIHYLEYHRLMSKPFKYPKKNEVWKLESNDGVIELLGNAPIEDYKVRYVKIPNPIILGDISEYGTIGNKSTSLDLECPESIHQEILNRAVILAKGIWQGVSSGAQSEGEQQ